MNIKNISLLLLLCVSSISNAYAWSLSSVVSSVIPPVVKKAIVHQLNKDHDKIRSVTSSKEGKAVINANKEAAKKAEKDCRHALNIGLRPLIGMACGAVLTSGITSACVATASATIEFIELAPACAWVPKMMASAGCGALDYGVMFKEKGAEVISEGMCSVLNPIDTSPEKAVKDLHGFLRRNHFM